MFNLEVLENIKYHSIFSDILITCLIILSLGLILYCLKNIKKSNYKFQPIFIILTCLVLLSVSIKTGVSNGIWFAPKDVEKIQFISNDYKVIKSKKMNGELYFIVKDKNGTLLNEDFFINKPDNLKKGDQVIIKTDKLLKHKDIHLNKKQYDVRDVVLLPNYVKLIGNQNIDFYIMKKGK